jgi:hypothetical protein
MNKVYSDHSPGKNNKENLQLSIKKELLTLPHLKMVTTTLWQLKTKVKLCFMMATQIDKSLLTKFNTIECVSLRTQKRS